MFDQMSMPILFAVLITALAAVSIGVFVAVRVMAARVDAPGRVIHPPNLPRSRELPAGQTGIEPGKLASSNDSPERGSLTQ
jgi:hypothetical protein